MISNTIKFSHKSKNKSPKNKQNQGYLTNFSQNNLDFRHNVTNFAAFKVKIYETEVSVQCAASGFFYALSHNSGVCQSRDIICNGYVGLVDMTLNSGQVATPLPFWEK